MKTVLPTSIPDEKAARSLLTALCDNGEAYHPDDNANDLVTERFTKAEGDQLNILMSEIRSLSNFDPYIFILNHLKIWLPENETITPA